MDAVFSMKIWYEAESGYDAAAVQYSTDFGASWNLLSINNDTANWYKNPVNVSTLVSQGGIGWSGSADSGEKFTWNFTNKLGDGSNGYLQVVHVLPNTAGQAFFVRVQFASDAVIEDDGVSVDDMFVDIGSNLCSM